MGRITASRTQLKGDPRHDSLLVSKFINCLMNDGKKTIAQRVFYDALGLIKHFLKTGLAHGVARGRATARS